MVKLTMLNVMADRDFSASLRRQKAWGIEWLDLRDAIYGNRLAALDIAGAERARHEIDESGCQVYCLSTSVFYDKVEKGEAHFRQAHLAQLAHVLTLAPILRPKLIRLNGAHLPTRPDGEARIDVLERDFPWVVDVYREAVDRIVDAGFTPTIENEAGTCFLSEASDFTGFFDRLDRKGRVLLTWDVVNQWATGVFPTAAIYQELKPLIGYYHVKGGAGAVGGPAALAWNVTLEEASWPVLALTRQVVADGVSPVICLNPPQHGAAVPDYDYESVAERDLDYLRRNVEGIE